MQRNKHVGLTKRVWLQQQQQVEPPQQQVHPPPPPPPPQQQVDPSVAAHHQVKELGSESEERIVREFYDTTKKSGDGTNNQNGEEISMYRYFIKSPVADSWADGELSSYSILDKKWGLRIFVKFYIVEDRNKEKSAKISQKVDEMLSMQSYTNVLVPIFQVYNERLESVILCYPKFDLHLGDWLQLNNALQSATENLLQPTWMNFIRDTLSCIESIDNMGISNFGDLSSYAWKADSECIKIILFPIATQKFGVQKALHQFADLLKNHIRSHWLHPELQFELDSFIEFMKFQYTSTQFWVNLADHTLLKDYEGISSLIARTWRGKLLKDQKEVLKLTMSCPPGYISWQRVPITDPVMEDMFSKGFSDDIEGFFAFIKELPAHYPENYRKYYKKLGCKDPNDEQHPVSLIKDTYPHVIAQICMLSKIRGWLK